MSNPFLLVAGLGQSSTSAGGNWNENGSSEVAARTNVPPASTAPKSNAFFASLMPRRLVSASRHVTSRHVTSETLI
jgi:hypothetical protein